MNHIKYFNFFTIQDGVAGDVSLVPVVTWLTLAHVMSAFSLSHPLRFQQQTVASKLQPISINLLSLSQHHHFRLNHFRIYFL
jgi:hypothetical protein